MCQEARQPAPGHLICINAGVYREAKTLLWAVLPTVGSLEAAYGLVCRRRYCNEMLYALYGEQSLSDPDIL
jgi:hypothetical protein